MKLRRPAILRRAVRGIARTVAHGQGMRLHLPFFAVSAIHLAAKLVEQDELAAITKTLLMPALALVLVVGLGRDGRWPTWGRLAVVGVFFSWLGDLALIGEGDVFFLSGVGLFAVAQLAYAFTFRAAGEATRTAGRPWLLVPYVAWWLALVAFFVAGEGITPLLGALALYGILLGTMAWLANRISTATAIGAALFVLSDSLIALGGLGGLELPLHGFWVMLTYLAAQWLIVRGLLLRSSPSATSAASTPSA
ncbi:lysoplasmalogenase [Nocardioides gilvus]|uniref:lysoplasmalogenase n=1 Tax=Nocardioides gilvus TaxID=1735589 RepID=UPI000D7435F9|nr:lysoplasmalogenase [Nocardioides gilvus]